MKFRLIDSGWDRVLGDALSRREGRSSIRIICPFIKLGTIRRLFSNGIPDNVQVITRFNPCDFCAGVSDVQALRMLLNAGAEIRGIKNLHAKLYLFGRHRVVVTSANLTDAAMLRNHEFGFVADDPEIVNACHRYFDSYWRRAGKNVTEERLKAWEKVVTDHLVSGARPSLPIGLADEGAEIGLPMAGLPAAGWIGDQSQAFVKLFGTSQDRWNRETPVLDEIIRAGCHWSCTYSKRPRQVQDGAIMFMGRLVKKPGDILVFGRGIGISHVPGRDDASAEDIERRKWRARWSHYIRVHHTEFVAGNLSNGVPLSELMDELGPQCFASTKRKLALGLETQNPRTAYGRQAAVELSQEGLAWMNERLQSAFDRYGKIPAAVLDSLDWPVIPRSDRPS